MLYVCRAQSSIIGYFGFRFTTAYNQILFCSLLFSVVVKAGYDKQDSLMHGSRFGKQMSMLTAINYRPSIVDGTPAVFDPTFVENCNFCQPHQPICIPRPH